MAEEEDPNKRPYVTPEITQVALRPEEAVLGACKGTGGGGPGSGGGCRRPSPCSSLGS
jgi:hypothetical protein